MAFWCLVLLLSMMLSRFIHVVQRISTLFIFYGWIIFHRMDIPHFSFPGGSDGKDSVMQRDTGLIPGLGRSPWRRECLPTLAFLPGESHGQRSLEGYSPWGREESDTTECLSLSPCFVYQWMDIVVVSTLRVFNTIINICIQAFFCINCCFHVSWVYS